MTAALDVIIDDAYDAGKLAMDNKIDLVKPGLKEEIETAGNGLLLVLLVTVTMTSLNFRLGDKSAIINDGWIGGFTDDVCRLYNY